MRGWWLIFVPFIFVWLGQKHGYEPPRYDEFGDPVCTEGAPPNQDCPERVKK